jgi:MFS family permease
VTGRYGWYVVAAAFVVALCSWGFGFYGPGVYLASLRALHGWPATSVAAAITLYYLCGATWIIFAGDTIDRFGAGRVVFAGACAIATGIALLPMAYAPWHVYPAFVVMSFGWAAMSGAAVNAIVAPWFDEKRGLAISLALNGSSCGGIVVTPLLVYLTTTLGFATGLYVALAGMLLVMVPVAIVLRRRAPHQDAGAAATSPWNRRTVLRDRAFVTIAIPFALGLVAQVGFLTHQLTYLLGFIGPQSAAFAVSATTVAAVLGRTGTGFVIDRMNPRLVSSGNFVLQIVGLATLLAAESTPMIYAGCILYGLGVGNLVTLPSLIVQREFARQDFSRIVSLIIGLNQFTFAFGPTILGALRDWSGSYRSSFVFCIALEAVAAVVIVLVRRPDAASPERRRRAA